MHHVVVDAPSRSRRVARLQAQVAAALQREAAAVAEAQRARAMLELANSTLGVLEVRLQDAYRDLAVLRDENDALAAQLRQQQQHQHQQQALGSPGGVHSGSPKGVRRRGSASVVPASPLALSTLASPSGVGVLGVASGPSPHLVDALRLEADTLRHRVAEQEEELSGLRVKLSSHVDHEAVEATLRVQARGLG